MSQAVTRMNPLNGGNGLFNRLSDLLSSSRDIMFQANGDVFEPVESKPSTEIQSDFKAPNKVERHQLYGASGNLFDLSSSSASAGTYVLA